MTFAAQEGRVPVPWLLAVARAFRASTKSDAGLGATRGAGGATHRWRITSKPVVRARTGQHRRRWRSRLHLYGEVREGVLFRAAGTATPCR
jgi:hypothetical protein